MKLILVEHGEPDYTDVEAAHYQGHGLDLAKLSKRGLREAEQASQNPLLKDVELIVSSPYTRALETAAILARNLNKPLEVETRIHEWMPDITFQYTSAEHFGDILAEMRKCKGERTPECRYQWESLSQVGDRVFSALKKYLSYQKIAVVAHGVVIQRFFKTDEVPHCSVWEYDFTEESTPLGYYE